MLKEGMKAPEFELLNQNGELVTLNNLLGNKIILYFYPKDMTSGCSKQACEFASLYPHFKEKGAIVIGVSADSVSSHKKFEEKYGLPFMLLSDPHKEVIKMYDVLGEKNMYGKKVMGIIRTTYLIDENGIIVKALGKVKPVDNPKEMLEQL